MGIPFIVNDDQFKVFIEHTRGKNSLAIKLMYYAGFRVSEVCDLKPHHIDLKKKVLCIEEGKNLKTRYVPIHPKLLTELRDFKPLDTNRRAIYAAVKRISRIMKWNVTPHTFRHSYATNLLNKGMSIREVQYLLGHSDISTTQRYLHTSLKDIKEKYNEVFLDNVS